MLDHGGHCSAPEFAAPLPKITLVRQNLSAQCDHAVTASELSVAHLVRLTLPFADPCDSNINDYCSIDPSGQKPVAQMTLGEKEQAFLEALSVC
jgi:hypothetical protein